MAIAALILGSMLGTIAGLVSLLTGSGIGTAAAVYLIGSLASFTLILGASLGAPLVRTALRAPAN